MARSNSFAAVAESPAFWAARAALRALRLANSRPPAPSAFCAAAFFTISEAQASSFAVSARERNASRVWVSTSPRLRAFLACSTAFFGSLTLM